MKTLIGYDLRLNESANISDLWDVNRRKHHLPCPTIVWPKSVDTSVWPSFFDNYRNDVNLLRERFGEIRFNFHYFCCPTMESIDTILQKVSSEEIKKLVLISVSIIKEHPTHCPSSDGLGVRSIEGYDVADEWLTSAISNCGIGDVIMSNRGPVLNVNNCGLFNNESEAFNFAHDADRLVHEHAPFYVYQIQQYSGDLFGA